MKPINMQTEYTTRDGRAVELISVSENCDHYPVLGRIVELGRLTWTKDGKHMVGDDSPNDLIEAVETKPVMFGDMTDAEKGALLLAQRNGKKLQYFSRLKNDWSDSKIVINSLFDGDAYRITPTRINGTVEVDGDGKPNFDTWEAEWYPEVKDGWSGHCYTPEPLVRPRSRKQGG